MRGMREEGVGVVHGQGVLLDPKPSIRRPGGGGVVQMALFLKVAIRPGLVPPVKFQMPLHFEPFVSTTVVPEPESAMRC